MALFLCQSEVIRFFDIVLINSPLFHLTVIKPDFLALKKGVAFSSESSHGWTAIIRLALFINNLTLDGFPSFTIADLLNVKV